MSNGKGKKGRLKRAQASSKKDFDDEKEVDSSSEDCGSGDEEEDTLTLYVCVIDPDPDPAVYLQGATVTLTGDHEANGQTDGDGIYEVQLPAGSYHAAATLANYVQVPGDEDHPDEKDFDLTDNHQMVEVYLTRLGTVRVTVRDTTYPATPVLLEDATVQLTAYGIDEEATTDAQGLAEFTKVRAKKYAATLENLGGQREDVVRDTNVQVQGGQATVLNLDVTFEKVFIVGEGLDFKYAKPLAEKYVGDEDTDRKRIFASQYDITDEPDDPPNNLVVYRDAVLQDDDGHDGRFDVTVQACWTRAGQALGTDFEAVIFNNPHPGYAVHKYECLGMTNGWTIQYVAVHTVGHDGTISEDQRSTYHNTPNYKNAQWDYLANVLHIQRDGTDTFADFTGGALTNRTLNQCFRRHPSGADPTPGFTAYQGHYRARRATDGLKLHILRAFNQQGGALLKSGGTWEVNGSTALQEALEDLGFTNAGAWNTAPHDIYFVDYETNLTSDTIHPSYLSEPPDEFKPGAPNLDNARRYRKIKP